MTNRKIGEFPGLKKSISKKDFQVKKFIFSPPAPKCTFDRSGGRRVRVFCTSSVRCDAGFDFFGSERAKGSRKTHLEFVADLKAREGFDFLARGLAWRRRVRNFRRAWRATENLEKYLAQQFDFQKRFSIQKILIVGRWRPKAFLTGRGHRRVRFFSARSGLATQGSNFYARDSRPC